MNKTELISAISKSSNKHGDKLEECSKLQEEAVENKMRADRLEAENAELKARLEKSVELPCKVGDTVWITEIIGIKDHSNGLPILGIRQGTVEEIEFNRNNEIWVRAFFGILYCCRKVEDFYFTKEAAEARIKELEPQK